MKTVALVKWGVSDGKSEPLKSELVALGYRVVIFRFDQDIPLDADVVFTFAPYGRLLQIPRRLSSRPESARPVWVHWNTEGVPNPRIPWLILAPTCAFRTWVDHLNDIDTLWSRSLLAIPPISWINGHMFRFRIVGDIFYAHRKGWIDLLVDFSELYAEFRRRHGVPVMVVPWGTSPDWHSDFGLERDIDVLWMGKRRNRRRSRLLDRVREQLSKAGVEMYVVDGEEHPFIFGEDRTRLLNRAKITLNLKTVWYDNVFATRFHMAAGNRSLVVSESFVPHYSVYKEGVHYVSADPDDLADVILHYLMHEEDRRRIVENAYQLVTTELTLANGVKTIMEKVEQAHLAGRL